MIFAVAVSQHIDWITSRAAGTAALVFSSLAVCIGLSFKLVNDRERAIKLGALHELLGLATVVTLLIHGFILLGDNFLRPNVLDIVVPFVEPFHRGAIGIGNAAGHAMIALSLLYYVRRRIGANVFRKVHRVTVLAWILSVVHTYKAGTDASTAWYLIVTLPFVVAVIVAAAVRLTRGRTVAAQPAPAVSTG